ncbi:hypothetical protein, partial [Collinsella intestinalis]|uniref:hypothetical protein n=1 Tax=Collinsella intestinalis TaxID=147207 RepID=UPI001956E7E3
AGEWGSTVQSTGSMTDEAEGSFTPDRAGVYTLAVDVQVGGFKRTASATVSVASIAVDGVDAPAEASTGEEVRYSADARGDL